MSDRPLVSIITPTWERPELLAECIENVRAQSYRPLEHVIVSDGQDQELHKIFDASAYLDGGCAHDFNSGLPATYPQDAYTYVPIRYVPLGRNWSSFLADSFCAAPLTVGMLVASGDYQMWLADDERMTADHIEGLVDALEAAGADFAYSRVDMWGLGRAPWTIGTPEPRLGEITNALYRTELLKHGLYPFGAGFRSDWACISRWMSFGARWAFVPRVTLTHRADH